MTNKIAFNVPINSVSFGQTSVALLREVCNEEIVSSIFPIGQSDLSSQPEDKNFSMWLDLCLKRALKKHSRETPVFKLWHINDAMQSVSQQQTLLTFHETDSLTDTEVNILNNQKATIVTSSYSKEVFEGYGVNNVYHVPLGLDTFNFKALNKKYYDDDTIVIGVLGKFENRKHTARILNLIAQKYGNNNKVRVHVAVFNPFFKQEDNQQLIGRALNGIQVWNFNFQGFLAKNSLYNDLLNSIDVVVGMSGGEAFDLPVYQSVALGKHCVALNAHVYKDYLNSDNAVLVEPSGKMSAVDNVFFRQDSEFNVGNFFTWEDEAFVSGLEKAVERARINKVNEAGKTLAKRTYKEVWLDIKSVIA